MICLIKSEITSLFRAKIELLTITCLFRWGNALAFKWIRPVLDKPVRFEAFNSVL